MVRSIGIRDSRDLGHYGWTGILAAVRQAMRSTVHTTLRATPTQLVFGRDALLNVSFEADWQYIKERKQKLILQNNKRENAKRIPHTYSVGDRVMVRKDPNRKHGSNQYKGPYTITRVNDNGTVPRRARFGARKVTATNSGIAAARFRAHSAPSPGTRKKPPRSEPLIG